MSHHTGTVTPDISSIYELALKRFKPDEQLTIKGVLLKWFEEDDIGGIVVPNLTDRERFLAEDCMYNILKAVLDNASKSLKEVVKAYQDECYNHVMRGGEVQENSEFPRPLILGRAVERGTYTNWLHEKFPTVFHEIDDAKDFVVKLLLGRTLTPAESALKINLFGAWVTWTPRAVSKDPFSFVLHDVADEVRACLGLDPKADGDLLLMTYESDGLDLFRPTVADANLFNYFEPAPKDFALHGWTRPWQADFLLTRSVAARLPKEYRPQRRPEAIHPRTEFSRIKVPIKRLS